MIARLLPLLTSRAGLAVMLCSLFWLWHGHDRRQAVAAARDGYVRAVELAAAQAALGALRRRIAASAEANRTLQEQLQAARGEALRFAAELEAYDRETEINPDGLVDPALLRRLRGR